MPNSDLIRRANDAVLERGDVDDLSTLFADDYVAHTSTGDRHGTTAVRGYARLIHKAFSEVPVEVLVLMDHDDRIAWRRDVRATHTGAFHGFPASGRELRWADIVVSRVEEGVIAEEWVVSDLAERLLAARKRR